MLSFMVMSVVHGLVVMHIVVMPIMIMLRVVHFMFMDFFVLMGSTLSVPVAAGRHEKHDGERNGDIGKSVHSVLPVSVFIDCKSKN